MIPNYEIDKFGVIHQIERKPFVYNKEYTEARYCSPEILVLSKHMSYLRMGYLCGVINWTPETLLDVGYGNGDFLSVAKDVCKEAYGYDIAPPDFLPEGCKLATSLTDRYYDVITFFDSLEHFPSIDIIRELDCSFIMISVPWCHNRSDEWFANWKHRRPDEHLHHFDINSLSLFMRDCGYRCLDYTNIEDIIRKPTDLKNILTAVFRKI